MLKDMNNPSHLLSCLTLHLNKIYEHCSKTERTETVLQQFPTRAEMYLHEIAMLPFFKELKFIKICGKITGCAT